MGCQDNAACAEEETGNPYERSTLKPQQVAQILKFQNEIIFNEPLYRYGKNGVLLPSFFQDYAEIIDQFPIQEDYIIVSSFPKAGKVIQAIEGHL